MRALPRIVYKNSAVRCPANEFAAARAQSPPSRTRRIGGEGRFRAFSGAASAAGFVLALLLLLPAGRRAGGQVPGIDDYSLVQQVPRDKIDAWLKEEVRKSGGDFERERYHFYIGFSTGHYGADPVHAIAMRRLAFSLLNNTLAPSDTVTPFAWEMRLWDLGPSIPLTDDPAARAQFVDAVAYAPAANSRGGHDVERALFDLLGRIRDDKPGSSVLLLLTNSNQSQGPTGGRESLFGADNPRLAALMKALRFRTPPARHSFTLRTKDRALTVDITALFPRDLRPLPGAPTTSRYPTFARDTWQPAADRPALAEALPNPVRPIKEGPEKGPPSGPKQKSAFNIWPWLLGAAVLAAVAYLIYRLTRRPPEGDKPKETVVKEPPMPGALTGQVGAQEFALTDLTAASRWSLVRRADGATEWIDAEKAEEESDAGTPLASVVFEPDRRMRLEAQGGAQFVDRQPVTLRDASDSRVRLAPGERLVCRIVAPGAAERVRLEIRYVKDASEVPAARGGKG